MAPLEDCLFCRFASGEIPVEKVAENSSVFAINDINPVAPTHILVIPKEHHENAGVLASEAPETLAMIFSLAKELAVAKGLSGYRSVFNTGASAGQSVFHAHLHLIAGRDLSWPPG
jgi:histidine triad (HIT) family protein